MPGGQVSTSQLSVSCGELQTKASSTGTPWGLAAESSPSRATRREAPRNPEDVLLVFLPTVS